MSDTLKLWDDIKADKYEVYMSNTTLTEVGRCPSPKLEILMNYVDNITYTLINNSQEIDTVAKQIINLGILTSKSLDDSFNISAAVVSNCDVIVSWNFKHLVNIKTIQGVRAIANLQGYKSIDIISPTMLVESEGQLCRNLM